MGASRAEHWGELKNTLLDVDLLLHLTEASAHAWLHAFERTVGGKGKSGIKMLGAQRCNPQSKDFHVVALSFVQIPADPANLSEELKLRIEKLVKRERRRVPWSLELMRPLR